MKNIFWKYRLKCTITGIAFALILAVAVPTVWSQPFVPQVPRVNGNTFRPTVPTVPFSGGNRRKGNNNYNNQGNSGYNSNQNQYPNQYQNQYQNQLPNQNPNRYANQYAKRSSSRDRDLPRKKRDDTSGTRERRGDQGKNQDTSLFGKSKDSRMASEKESEKSMGPRQTFEEQFPLASATDPIQIDHESYITSDGVWLVGDYYKGNADENTIPVLLLHDREQNRETMSSLAKIFAGAGMAVLCPDFRGHGESTRRMVQDYSSGDTPVQRINDEYFMDDFTNEDYKALLNIDCRFWYNFLIAQHNFKRINLRKLIVIGPRFGAAVGAYWVRLDWSAPNAKRGRFARALVMISPDDRCANSLEAIKRSRPGDSLSFLFFVGDMNEEMFEGVKKLREKVGGRGKGDDTPETEKKAIILHMSSEKQGMDLVGVESFKIPELITKFIELRLSKARPRDLAWQAIKFDE